jgi:hypothetical protein
MPASLRLWRIIDFDLLFLKRALLLVAGLFVGYLCFVIWFVFASDYSDRVVVGEYHVNKRLEQSMLILRPNHTFAQEITRNGRTQRAQGTWRLFGQAGIAFSKDFLGVSGQDFSSDGTAYGAVRKAFGIGPTYIALSQYHVLWYGRRDASTSSPIAGIYVGDDEHSPSTLTMKADHTFEQTVTRDGNAMHAKGAWALNKDGDIAFSKEFLDFSGRPIAFERSASAWNPKGSNLQIVVSVKSPAGAPIFRKSLF